MRKVRYSQRSEADLDDIVSYTIRKWSEAQADKYLLQMAERCDFLAANPDLGRPCDALHLDLRRYSQGNHVIFYKKLKDGIWVARILHEKRLPGPKHFK